MAGDIVSAGYDATAAVYWDPRPKAAPGAEVSQMHARYVRIATACVDAYLAGQTEYSVETHPQAQAAYADWMAADRGPEKSQFI